MKESEQAQAIAEIRAILQGGSYSKNYYIDSIVKALNVVDSQAQKIATLTQCNETQATQIARQFWAKRRVYEICMANIRWQREQRKLQAQKIAEQAKEIEILKLPAVSVGPDDCEFCNGKGFRDIELPADMGNHTTEDCHWCKGSGDDNSENIHCAGCGLFWNELVIARGQAGNIHACSDCGGEWVRL